MFWASAFIVEAYFNFGKNSGVNIFMDKHAIRLISFILALFLFIMIFQNIMNEQQQLPLGTKDIKYCRYRKDKSTSYFRIK